MTSQPAPKRPLRIVDIVVGIVLAIFAALLGVVMLANFSDLNSLSCASAQVDGLRCNTDFLHVMVGVGFAFVIFAWFVTAGVMVVRFLQRRRGFWLPLVGFGVMVLAYYAIVLVLGTSFAPAS